MFRWYKRTRRSLRDWSKDRRRYLRFQWHRLVSGILVWWESLKTSHEDGLPPAEGGGRKFQRPPVKAASFLNPFFWFAGGLQFLLRYMFSRRPMDLVVSVPGLLGVVGPFFCLFVWLPPSEALVSRHKDLMQQNLRQDQFKIARFYADCWKSAEPWNPEVEVSLALLEQQSGDGDASDLRLRRLISETRFAPAMGLFARRALPRVVKETGWTPAAVELRQMMSGLLQDQPDNVEGGFVLSTLYVSRQEWNNALLLLRQFAGKPSPLQANLLYTKAVVEAQLNYLPESRRSASEGSDILVRQLMLNPSDKELLIQTVQCLTLAGREADALLLLRDRIPTPAVGSVAGDTAGPAPGDELQYLMADVLASRSRRIRLEPVKTADMVAEAVSCLRGALQLAPNNRLALEELSRLALADLGEGSGAGTDLQELLDSGIEPGLLHFILGSQAVKRGSSAAAEAAAHFEKAIAHGAGFPVVLNNFANLIADTEDGDIAAADRMIEEALKQLPNQAELYDTRGKIRLRQGRVSEAIADFELALKEPRIRSEVYMNLAKACKLAGDDTSARRYEQLGKERSLPQ